LAQFLHYNLVLLINPQTLRLKKIITFKKVIFFKEKATFLRSLSQDRKQNESSTFRRTNNIQKDLENCYRMEANG